MGYQRGSGWKEDTQVFYTSDQVEGILEDLGVIIDYETGVDFVCFCPFHANDDSPAFWVNYETGWFHCFNPACAKHGANIEELIMEMTDKNIYQARRMVLLHRSGKGQRPKPREPFAFVQFPVEPVERMRDAFFGSPAHEYMKSRGFTDETMKYFEIGYSDKQNKVIMPMHDPDGMLVGFVARSLTDKVFLNSPKLPKAMVPWNFHRAKKTGGTVIIVESITDAMKIHQAGYPNVIATLGTMTKAQEELIAKTFNRIIIMTDFDWRQKNPCPICQRNGFMMCQGHRDGRDLGRRIVAAFPNKQVLWAAYDDTCVYPHSAKDANELSDEEIAQCLKNAVRNFTYVRWGIENKQPVAV